MSTLDIRTGASEGVDVITFSDSHYGWANRITRLGDNIRIADNDGDGQYDVLVGDLDNLILALQKAKELWSR